MHEVAYSSYCTCRKPHRLPADRPYSKGWYRSWI